MTEPRTIHKLSMIDAHKLATLMLHETDGYTAKCMTLNEYAEFAAERLGIEVSKQHVHTRVREFELKSGEPIQFDQRALLLTLSHLRETDRMELDDLKERIARLEGWVNTTFPTKGPLKVVG